MGPAGVAWGPLSRRQRHWPSALSGTALVHLLGVLPALLLIARAVPPSPPIEQAIQLVFAAPAEVPAPPSPAATPPPVQAAPPPPVQAAPPPPPPPTPEVSPPAPQAPPEPAQEAEPLPLPPPPAPPPPPRRQVTTTRKSPAAPQAAAPATPVPTQAPPSAAASQSAPAQPDPAMNAAWQHSLAAWLAEHRVYPEAARRRDIQGKVTLRFSVDRSGHVVGVTVLHGSGSDILDQAAEAMLRSATVPAPPPTNQEHITVSVQVDYILTD